MSTPVLHVVESAEAAGAVAACLPGLLEAMRPLGYDGAVIDDVAAWSPALRDAGVVHVHGWGYPLAAQAARDARKSGKPYVLSPSGLLTAGPYRPQGWLRRMGDFFSQGPLVRGAAAVTALHEMELDNLRNAGVHANSVLLPYGFSFDAKEPEPGRVNSPHQNLLMLDPLDPQYGCVVLLKAFAEVGLAADGWSVTLAGEDRGQWRTALEAAVRRKGGESRVTFQPAVSTADRVALLAGASALVCPALHIAPALSIMQAVNAFVPVLAARPTAPPGMNGAIRVCGAERAQLRDALRDLLAMPPDQRRALAQQARKKACELFDWSVLAPRYASLYAACARN